VSIANAVSAFTHRGARRATAVQLALYSFGLAALLIGVAAWAVSRAEDPPGGTCYEFMRPCAPTIAWSVLGLADLFAVWLLGVGLFLVAPAAVAAAVAAERRAGTLDQLRTTPLSPLSLAAGIVLGAPVKLYLLLIGPLALHLFCGVTGVIPADTLVMSLGVLATGGLASAAVGLAVALAPRQETGGALVALGVAAALGFLGFVGGAMASEPHGAGWAFLHPAGALDAAMLEHDGIWRRLMTSPWRIERFEEPAYAAKLALAPVGSCVASLALAVALGLASCRKLAAPHRPLFSKGLGMALFAGLAAGVVGPLELRQYGWDTTWALLLVMALFLLPMAALIGLHSAPTFEAWAQGLRAGGARWWRDEAAPHVAMWIMAATLASLELLRLGADTLAAKPERHEWLAMLWTAGSALALPIYVHFLATRYATAAARWAFGAAICAHATCQAIAIGLLLGSERGLGYLFVQAAAVAAVVVPAVVVARQLALRARTIAA
jgi:ABC-2 family transporter protein